MGAFSKPARLFVSVLLNIKISLLFFCFGFAGSQAPEQIDSEEYQDVYKVDTVALKGILFESPPHRYGETDSQPGSVPDSHNEDTLELQEKSTKSGKNDSMSKSFKKYWSKIEKREGIDKLRTQIQSNDIDKTWIPHLYLFDSNLVIFPGWFIIRKKPGKYK